MYRARFLIVAIVAYTLNFESFFISSPNCSLFTWSEMIVFISCFMHLQFSTVVVSLSCPLYVIAIICFVLSGQINIDR